MLTGLEPPTHGARNNGFHLADDRTTLAETLASHGYATAAFVSAFILDRRFGLAQGFETYDEVSTAREGATGFVDAADANCRPAAAVTDAALDWLRGATHAGKPFFAWIHYFDAHFPYTPPPEYARQFRDQPYDGEIAYIDAQFGRVLDLLRREGADRHTLVVVAADHGEGLGEHGEPTHAYLIYDSTLHVPLILHGPAALGAPRVIDDWVVSLADIMPTVLDLLGLPAPGPMDGRDLLSAPAEPDRAIYVETLASRLDNGWAALYGLRRLHDKYILAPRREYFDLRSDPGEQRNLASNAPREMAELDARLAQRMAGMKPFEHVAQEAYALPAEDRQRLASLGYVQAPDASAASGLRDPKDMLPLWKRVMAAELASQNGRSADAIAEIESVLRDDPTDGHAWYYAASIYGRCQHFAKSEAAIRHALALSPSAAGYATLAQLLLMRGVIGNEFEEAIANAKRLDPSDGRIYIARGDWHASQGRLPEALAAYEKASRLDPVNAGRVANEKIEGLRRHL
jgi:cytochrome c-type biogenesis protein CcmH/NrfG